MNNTKRTFLSLLQWGAGIAALVWALHDVELKVLWQSLEGYSFVAMLPVFGFAFVDYVALGFRLAALLPKGVGLKKSVAASMLCVGMNCLLPAKAGDALKILYLTRETGHSFITISAVAIWERLCDIVYLVGFMLFSWSQMQSREISASLSLPVAVLLAGCAGFFLLRRWSGFFHALYARFLPGKIARPLSHLHSSIVDQVTVTWVGKGLLWSLVTWGTYFLSFVFACRMAGIFLDPAPMMVVFTMAALGTAIPSLPGGIGLFEGAVVLALSWYGVESSQALGVALFFHAVHFLPLALIAICINGRAHYWEGTRKKTVKSQEN